jgi:hypothetical protein
MYVGDLEVRLRTISPLKGMNDRFNIQRLHPRNPLDWQLSEPLIQSRRDGGIKS